MKRIILSLSIFLFSFSSLLAQTLYTRTDSIAITGDSVTLQAGTFRGAIQWQRSLDGTIWDNLTGKTDSLLMVAKTSEGFYRAQLTDGTCLPTYSDTAVVVANKAANNLITDPDEIPGASFVERDGGTFTFVSTSGATIPVSTVFVDSDKESDIRVVTGTTKNGDTLSVSTKPGTMEDLFFDQEFKLSTEMLLNSNKSAYLTTEALANAMKDNKGFIHPVEVIDNNGTNSLKSTQIIDESLATINFTKDFSGKSLWSEGGADISISEGYYKLGAVLNYEFLFSPDNFDWQNISYPKGKLQKFKIYTDKEATGIETKLILTASTTHSFDDEIEEAIKEDVFNKTFKYLIPVSAVPPILIPFWATVKIDLMQSSSVSISGEASVTGGVSTDLDIELGVSYENGTWTPIKSATPEFTLEGPEVDAKVNVQAKVAVYPHIEVQFYSTLAPYLEIGPYVREEMECSAVGNYKYDFCSGVDASVGVKAEIFGHEIFDYNKDFNLNEDTLYTSPKKVQVVSGANQKVSAGKPLPQPIVLKVVDSKDNPVKNTLIHFKASLGKLFKALLSSPENAELKSAMLFASAGDSTQLAVTSDTTGQVTINWTLADSTAKHKLEAYLMNGKDSIREDTRDTITAEVDSCDCEGRFKYFTDSRDGHVYKTIKIGTQTWMAENLAYLPIKTDTTVWSYTEPCYYEFFYPNKGVSYNWKAAINSCPTGWHLPNNSDWSILANYLGGEMIAGQKMIISNSTTFWTNNSSCFSAIPGATLHFKGCRDGEDCEICYQAFINRYMNFYFWSSTEANNCFSYEVTLASNLLKSPYGFKVMGRSIRCIKD